MAERRPLVIVSGRVKELPTGDTLPGMSGGKVLQVKTVVDSTSYSVYNAVIPIDGTIPQNTEGEEYAELAMTITPTAADSKIVLRYTLNVASQTANSNTVVFALFVDTTANALFATIQHVPQSLYGTVSFDFVVDAGSTSARTYKLRTGQPNGSRYHYINRTAGTDAHFGGVEGCSVVAMEVDV